MSSFTAHTCFGQVQLLDETTLSNVTAYPVLPNMGQSIVATMDSKSGGLDECTQ